MIVKICKIHGELTTEQVSIKKNKYYKIGYYLRCTECYKQYYLKNSEKIRQYNLTIAEKIREKKKQYRLKNAEKIRERDKQYNKKNSEIRSKKTSCSRLNITLEQYDEIFERDNRRCSICGNEETRKLNGKTINLCIDHCHKTGKIRGLLCGYCNFSIGFFDENIERIKSGVEFLTNPKERTNNCATCNSKKLIKNEALCIRCKKGIYHLKYKKENLFSAIRYLKHHNRL